MTPSENKVFIMAQLFLRLVVYFATCVLVWDWVAVPMGAPALSVWQVVALAMGIRVVTISPQGAAADKIQLALMNKGFKISEDQSSAIDKRISWEHIGIMLFWLGALSIVSALGWG